MSRLRRTWIIITGILLLLVACTPQTPLPTLAPTPIPPTQTPSPTVTNTPTLTPTATQAVPQTEATDPTLQSYIRIINISQIAEPIDVYIDNLSVAVFLEYSQFTASSGIVAGNYTLHVVPARGRPGDGSLIQQPITIGGQQSLIVLISGTIAAPQVQIVIEDTSPLGAGESRISVFNAIADGPAFVLQMDETDTALSSPIAPGNMSPAIVLPESNTTLALVSGETVLKSFPARLRERQNYTLIVIGQGSNRESLNILTLNTPVSGIVRARAIHAAFGAENIDFYAGSIRLGENISFGSETIRQTLVSGIYDIAVYNAGADPTTDKPLATQQLALNPDDVFSFIFIGELNNYEIIAFEETLALTPLDEARITFIHVMPSVPTIQLQAGDMLPLRLNYGEVSDTFYMLASPTTFGWAVPEAAGIGDLLEFAEDVELLVGTNYLYLFTGRRLGFPLIFQETVGAIVPTPDPDDFTPTPTQIPTTTLRVVNAIPGAFVDFRVDDVTFASAVPYQAGSAPVIILDGDRVVTAHDQATGNLLGRTIVTVSPGIHYSVYISPSAGLNDNMTVTEDILPPLDEVPYVRLVNTSSVNTAFGLAYSEPVPGSDLPPVIDPAETPPAEGGVADDPYRVSLPFGAVRLIDDIFTGNVSPFIAVSQIRGAKDIQIIDNFQTMVAATIANVTLESDTYYDIVAFQQESSTQVTAFILPYPPLP